MFDKDQVNTHQEFIEEQVARKEKLGKPSYATRKLWEELEELRDELDKALNDRDFPENLIPELGDFLFCVLGDRVLAEQLQQRLSFNTKRAEQRKQVDLQQLQDRQSGGI